MINFRFVSTNRTVAFVFLILSLLAIQNTSSGQIIPPNRRTVWQENVGVPGGIPHRTTIYTNIPAGSSAAVIQAAINNCPSNQVVLLAAGNYTIGTTLKLKSGVTLRGAGLNSTKLIRSGVSPVIDISSTVIWDWDRPVAANHVNWISGYTQGSTTLTLASTNLAGLTANVPVGRIIFIDQLNDTNTSAYGTYNSVTPGGYTSLAKPNLGDDRYQNQMSRVVSKSGNQITISPGIFMPNHRSELLPQVWWESANPIEFAGVEDLWITVTDSTAYAIAYHNAYACWSKNVRTTQARRHHSFWQTVNCEVRHCTLEGASGSGDDYAIAPYNSSALLMEDNIINGCGGAMVATAMSGSVFAYNYVTNALSGSWMGMGLYLHGGHPNMNLFEGNVSPGLAIDNGWGSSIYTTALRNRFTGVDEYNFAGVQNYVQAISIGATNRFQNIVGNVLGTRGKNTQYESYAQTSGCGEAGRIYFIGYKQAYCSSPWDPVTYTTLIRAYNWDSVTSTNNGIVAGGYASQDVPSSYYLSAKPNYFGNLAWPPVDPANPVYSSSRTNIPAGYRFLLGIDPPTGPVNQPPLVMAGATPTIGAVPLAVTFSSAGTSDPESALLTYRWDFGDGTTSASPNPSHTYSIAGDYRVQLAVSDGTNTTTSSNIIINATGLVAAYAFDEGSGNTARDTTGNQSDGIMTNATRVTGRYGLALLFNGTNSVVSINNLRASALASKMTIEAWVKPAEVGTKWLPVLGKGYNGSELSYVLQGTTPQNGGAPSLYLAPSESNLFGSTSLPTNAWSHLAATFEGTTLRLYVNGLQVASKPQTDSPNYSNDPLTIGSDGLLTAFWSGAIDEVRIYNRALSVGEIQSDMNTPIGPQLPLSPQNLRIVP